ncbi:hypothetical protein ACFVUW_01970 [Streptomyces xiamenensis]|uniref:hypothetical protein n=1 Tax=Streptomyces xiamenensis TaxID=408015 RepID=UPI0036E7AC86
MLSYREVAEQDFGALISAAESWERAAEGFGEAEADHRTRVHHATSGNAEVWSGLSADAATDRFAATERELAAAQEECRGIARLLRDGEAELARLRGRLMSLVEEARAAGFAVNAEGQVSVADRQPNDPETQRLDQVAAEWRLELDRAVSLVSAADMSLALELKDATTGLDLMGGGIFNGAALTDAQVPAGKQAADLALRLHEEGELSEQEWFELNQLMASHADDVAFHRMLLTELGADGLLALSAQVAGHLGDGGDEESRHRYAILEQRLANTVAVATRTPALDGGIPYGQWIHTEEGRFYESWMSDIKEMGTERYEVPGLTDQRVTGYQLLTTVLSSGEGYPSRFLQDMADGIRAAEDPSQGGSRDIWRLRADSGAWDGLSGTELGRFALDPMNTILDVMAGNPEASAAYLDPDRNDNLDYLLNDREWAHLSMEAATSVGYHQNVVETADSRWGMANALESATTGIPVGTESPTENPALHRTEEGARVMQHVVEAFATRDGALISDDGDWSVMRPQLGRMTAAYMGDFQDAISMGVRTMDPPQPSADFGRSDLASFLSQLGRDPEAYGYITASQQAYTAMSVDYVLHTPTGPETTVTDRLNNAVWPGAIIAGLMADARITAVYEDGIAADEAFNENLDVWMEFSGLVLDEAVGKITDNLPVGGSFVEWGVEALKESIDGTLRRDSGEEAAEVADDLYEESYADAIASAERAVTVAANGEYDEAVLQNLHNSVNRAVQSGFGMRIGWKPPEVTE